MRVELTTFTLGRGEHPTVSTGLSGLTVDAKCACISACTPDTEMENDKAAQDSGKESDFTRALALIATLPLLDAEKAEAVRRLLANKSAGS